MKKENTKLTVDYMVKALKNANTDLLKDLHKKVNLNLVFISILTAFYVGFFEYKFAILYGGFWQGLLGFIVTLFEVIIFLVAIIYLSVRHLIFKNSIQTLEKLSKDGNTKLVEIAKETVKEINKKQPKKIFVKKQK